MKVKLLRAAQLHGHDYAKGTHDVPDAVASHWFFLALLTNGHAEVLEAPKKAVVAPPAPAPEALPEAPVEEILEEDFRDGDDQVEDEVESPEAESVSHHGKKKKHKRK